MTELLTAAQMRAIEQAAIARGGVTGLDLMERAGRGVVAAIFEEWPDLAATSHRAVVLCGPGGNGGDGFVVARLLKDWGWEVAVFLCGDPERMPPDARVNYERWRAMGEVGDIAGVADPRVSCGADLVVDALFGIGLSRAVGPLLDRLFPAGDLRDTPGRARVVSIDVPSGLCADSGRRLGGRAVPADLTVTFHRAKIGHWIGDGPATCATLRVKDIGLDPQRATPSGSGAPWPGEDPACGLVTRPDGLAKRAGAHKYGHGHALILSGPPGRGGAARLSARGALRIGAGLVTVGCPAEAVAENAARLDAIMLREVDGADDLRDRLGDGRITALCLGPGLGTAAREADLASAALAWILPHDGPLIDAKDAQVAAFLKKHGHRPACVLDADALTLLAAHPELFAALHEGCVLTPHAGEFARLFQDMAAKLAEPATTGPAYSKVDATREAAVQAGCTVVFKGPDTVIADPSGRCAVHSAWYDRAAPWLATAGSGDVLSGFIVGLLARGFRPFDAACAGAWLHVECARRFGPGLIAEDLPEQLPAVFRDLGI